MPAHHYLKAARPLPLSARAPASHLITHGHARPFGPSLADVFDHHDYERCGALDVRGLVAALAHVGATVSGAEAAALACRYGASRHGDAFITCTFPVFATLVRDLTLSGAISTPSRLDPAAVSREAPPLASRPTPIQWYGHRPAVSI